LVGYAIGAAVAGVLIDNVSADSAWYVTGVSAALALAFALVTVRLNPSLEQKDS